MAYTTRILVVASVTATSPDLLEALEHRAERGPIAVTLLVPAPEPGPSGRAKAQESMDATLAAWREAGIEAEGVIGDTDPVAAVQEEWSPGRFDEIVVSTLPGNASKWLTFDVPHRIARITDTPVMHVVSRPPGPPGGPPPPREKSLLGPLSVLSWGGRKD